MLKFASEMATHIQPNKIWLVSALVSLPTDQGDMSLGQNLLSKTSQPIDFASWHVFFKSSTKLKYDAIHIYPPQPECPGATMDTATCGLGRAQWQSSFCCLILGILSHCQWLSPRKSGTTKTLLLSAPLGPPSVTVIAGIASGRGFAPTSLVSWSHLGWLNPHDTESNGFIWHISLKGLNPNYIHHYTSILIYRFWGVLCTHMYSNISKHGIWVSGRVLRSDLRSLTGAIHSWPCRAVLGWSKGWKGLSGNRSDGCSEQLAGTLLVPPKCSNKMGYPPFVESLCIICFHLFGQQKCQAAIPSRLKRPSEWWAPAGSRNKIVQSREKKAPAKLKKSMRNMMITYDNLTEITIYKKTGVIWW